MKSLSLALIGLISISMAACINNEEKAGQSEMTVVEIRPGSFEITAQTGNTVTITMTQNCGSACWADLQDEIERDGNTYSMTTRARVTSEICTRQCVEYTRDYVIQLPEAGTYEFHYVLADTSAVQLTFQWEG